MRFVYIALILVSAALCGNAWRLCPGSPTDRVQVSTVSANPWPMLKGREVSCQIGGTTLAPISQRNARLDVYMGPTKVYSSFIGSAYTVPRGSTYNYSLSMTIPSFVPPGMYDIRVSAVDLDGNTVTCIELIANF